MKSIVIAILAIAVFGQARVDWDNLNHADIKQVVNGKPFFPKKRGNERVVGGEEVIPHSRPFQVALFIHWNDGQSVFCGGSLISPTTVLTVGQCLTPRPGVSSVEVVLGAHNIMQEEPTQVRVNTTEFIVHYNYHPVFLVNDIALIRLSQPVKLNENIAVVTLPTRSDALDEFTGVSATVSGWGMDSDSVSKVDSLLRETSNPIISNRLCWLSYPTGIEDTHICVSGRGGRSSCSDDMGGPLTIERVGDDVQVGIVSFNIIYGCSAGFPHVYTRVTEYLDWIQDNSDVIIN